MPMPNPLPLSLALAAVLLVGASAASAMTVTLEELPPPDGVATAGVANIAADGTVVGTTWPDGYVVRWVPGAAPEVGDVRKGDGKGRHTTTTSNLYQAGGITIIDTPGIRELGVRGVPRREFAQYWRDFGAYAGECRFRDCIHVNEPGCAVREAVEAGDLPDFRYQSYLRILDDLEA